jgi:viroplasmin and RNaseH domain-containing protein
MESLRPGRKKAGIFKIWKGKRTGIFKNWKGKKQEPLIPGRKKSRNL